MQENNDTIQTTSQNDTPVEATETAQTTAPVQPRKRRGFMRYLVVVGIVVVMAAALLYVLERQGRVTTGLFGDVVGDQAVAYVNGAKIIRRDHENNVSQLLQMASAQGVDTTDTAIVAEIRTQALDTLINGELLRQAAIEAGMVATAEAIDARFLKISSDLGGEEQLRAKMAEFDITEEMLRRDIENEILIQGLFDAKFPAEGIEVTDDEVTALYESISAGAENVPPLDEVRGQIVEQIKRDRQQLEVSNLIESLRTEATIETLI